MQEGTTELRFDRGDATPDELQSAVDDILAELRQVPGGSTGADASAVSSPALAGAQVRVREAAHGTDPLTAIIIGISIAGGSKVAGSLWDDLIWPRLVRRLGVRALRAPATSGTEQT